MKILERGRNGLSVKKKIGREPLFFLPYFEFQKFISNIKSNSADRITFETSQSDFYLLKANL